LNKKDQTNEGQHGVTKNEERKTMFIINIVGNSFRLQEYDYIPIPDKNKHSTPFLTKEHIVILYLQLSKYCRP